MTRRNVSRTQFLWRVQLFGTPLRGGCTQTLGSNDLGYGPNRYRFYVCSNQWGLGHRIQGIAPVMLGTDDESHALFHNTTCSTQDLWSPRSRWFCLRACEARQAGARQQQPVACCSKLHA